MLSEKEHLILEGFFPVIYPWMSNKVFNWLKPPKAMVTIASLNELQKRKNIHKVLNYEEVTFLDCGAFQLTREQPDWNRNRQIRQKLVSYYRSLKPEIASALDIPYTFKGKNNLEAIEWSLKNYLAMRKQLDNSILLVPGFCLFSKDAIEFLSRKITRHFGEPEVIALGGQVQLMRTIETTPRNGNLILRNVHQFSTAFPKSRVHVYGLGEHRWYMLIRLLGASSSDYASYVGIAGRGGIMLPGLPRKYILKKVRVMKGNKPIYYTRPSSSLIRGRDLLLLYGCECPICRELGPISLEFNRDYRIVHNLHVSLSETDVVDNYCRNNDYKGLAKHIRERLLDEASGLNYLAKYALDLFHK